MMRVWKTLKLFMSSTFKDLERERDAMAQVFQKVQERLMQRRLHLIPYDMRWQDTHDKDLVSWCLETVRSCQYFVGILGYRYGWRPPHHINGTTNDRRFSITEMEIDEALITIPRSNRFFCFGDLAQYSDSQLASESAEDLASLTQLKQRLKDLGEDVFEYQRGEEVPQMIERELLARLDRDFPAERKAELESYSRREALAEMLAEKRRGFVGQRSHLEHLKSFCADRSKDNIMGICAVAGTGKSALLAHLLHEWQLEHPDIPIIAHYMSMAGDSRSISGLMQSLGEQLRDCGLLGEQLALSPEQWITQVRSALQALQQPVIVAIDGLDEMDEDAWELDWLPPQLPPEVRVLLTTRPVETWQHLQRRADLQTLDLPPLSEDDIHEIIRDYQREYQLSISRAEEDILVQRAAGNPLFLKVALDELVAGGIAVGQMAETIDALFRQILQRLEARYGSELIRDYLGLIAASRSGLMEAELRKILSASHQTQPRQIPPQTQASWYGSEFGGDVLLAIEHSLANFVILRENLLNFFHPEFERSVKMLLGRADMRDYHRRLAQYYQQQGYAYERALAALPYQYQWSEQYDALLRLFGDLRFLEAKCTAGMLSELRWDMAQAMYSTAVPLPRSSAVEIAPEVEISRNTIALLMRILDFEFHFLSHHPECLFQSLWNRGYWHDSPDAAIHYTNADDTALWHKPKASRLSSLVEYWRVQQNNTAKAWIRTLRPLPDRLDSQVGRIFRGHEDLVTSVYLSDDGQFMASASWDRTVRVWDTTNGKCRLHLRGHEEFIAGVCISPNGKKIFSASGDGTVRVWHSQSGQCLQILSGHQKQLTAVACHPDNVTVASGSKDKQIRLWNSETGGCLRILEGHNKLINGLCFSADGQMLISGAWDNTVRLWDVHTGECLRILEGHTDTVRSVCITADNRTIISVSKDHTARIWEVATGRCLYVLQHRDTVFSVAANEEGTLAATGIYGTMYLWEIRSGHLLAELEGHESAIFSLSMSRDGQHVASASGDKTIRLWDIESSRSKLSLESHTGDIRSVNLIPDGSAVISASKDQTIRKWHPASGQTIAQWPIPNGIPTCVHSSEDARYIASGDNQRTIHIWDTQNQTYQCLADLHTKVVTSIYLSPDGQLLLSGSRDYKICLWDMSKHSLVRSFEGHQGDIRALFLHNDLKHLLSGAEDKTVRLWDASTGESLLICQGHEDGVLSVGMSYDGRWLFSSSRDNSLRIWDANTGKCVRILRGRGEVNALNMQHYAMAQGVETAISCSESHQPIAFFPAIIRQANISHNGIIAGYAGIHLLLAQLVMP
jgi:WD40 repeat protein